MAIGFDRTRRFGPSVSKLGLTFTEATPASVIYEAPAARPENPVLKSMPAYRPRSKFMTYWDTPLEGSDKSRVDHLLEMGSRLGIPDEDFISPPAVDFSAPAPANHPSRGGSQNSRDVLARVRARYGL